MDVDSTAVCPQINIQIAREASAQELAPIPEGKPLCDILDPSFGKTDHVYVQSCEEEKRRYSVNERTPLLHSTDSDASDGGPANSIYNHSFTTSQASLFIPSIQVSHSLYSSRRSRSMLSEYESLQLPEKSTNSSRHNTTVTTSLAVSLLDKITSDGQAPAFLALWNIINMIQGVSGVLGAPYAVALGGIASLLAIVVLGLMCDLTAILLIDCLYQVSPKNGRRKRVRESYSEIAATVWGPFGGKLLDCMTVVYSYSICALFMMLLATSVHDVVGTLTPLSINQWCLVCTFAVLPIVFVRKLSVLAWFSMVAVLAIISCVFILLGYSTAHNDSWTLATAESMLEVDKKKFPIALGIIVFGFCGHYVFPGIEGSMRKPQKFNKIAHGAFGANVIVKLAVGCLCFLTFGAQTNAIVTLNLSAMTHRGIISMITSVLMFVNVYLSYPLQMYVVTSTLDLVLLPMLPAPCAEGGKYHVTWTLFTRTALVFSTFGVAIAVPQFGLLMGIFGSVLGICLCFIFPCVFHLSLKRKSIGWCMIIAEVVVIVFGFIAGVLGVVFSSLALKDVYSS